MIYNATQPYRRAGDMRPQRSSKKDVSLLWGESGLTPPGKANPTRYGNQTAIPAEVARGSKYPHTE